ncbi:MAG: sugar phosphate isomerase/epimerase [Deltaproteobacteria bacterium]|nr:sugar phosphate isomerase/epimerase [Deltaproteobacteria bacterium]
MAVIGGRAHTIEEVHAVGKGGYPFAEISLYDAEQVEGALNELLRLKREYGINYLAHFPNEGNPVDLDNLSRRFVPRMKRLFELCPPLGITQGTFHFWIDERYIPPEAVSGKIDMMTDMVQAAQSLGIVLCLENLSEPYHDFMPAFDRIPDLRMTLDIGHAQLMTDENTSFGFIDNCFERIGHIHVHDNRGGMSVNDDLHLPLGEGIVDYPGIFTRLKDKGYASTISMEVKPPAMSGTKEAILKYIS